AVVSGSTTVASNDDWDTATNRDILVTTSQSLGAFTLTPLSGDAAWLGDLAAGAYTVPVTPTNNDSGVVLLELYDAGAATDSARLLNASTRAYVGTGANVLIAGFTIEGSGTLRLLLRAVGP